MMDHFKMKHHANLVRYTYFDFDARRVHHHRCPRPGPGPGPRGRIRTHPAFIPAHDTVPRVAKVVAVSKSPTWNNVTGTFGLAFSGGRVATDSVKNIQLLQQGVQQGDSGANGEKEHSVLEFGKYRGEEFCLDVSYPFSPFTAFAIALTAFDVPSKF